MMFDWIFVFELMDIFMGNLILIVALVAGACFISACFYGMAQDLEPGEVCKRVKGLIKPIIILTICWTFLWTITGSADILVKTNIKRIKIYYTSPQAVKKVETGALKVIDKLDKLIDKGIESVEK
jgi:hypothetical protein